MRINKKIVITIISVICILLILSNFSYALNTDVYQGIYNNDGKQTSITKFAGYALGVVQVVGMSVATIGIIVLAIKYIVSSPEDKATIKDKAVIYVTGAVIIFAASGLIGLIGKWAQENVK